MYFHILLLFGLDLFFVIIYNCNFVQVTYLKCCINLVTVGRCCCDVATVREGVLVAPRVIFWTQDLLYVCKYYNMFIIRVSYKYIMLFTVI